MYIQVCTNICKSIYYKAFSFFLKNGARSSPFKTSSFINPTVAAYFLDRGFFTLKTLWKFLYSVGESSLSFGCVLSIWLKSSFGYHQICFYLRAAFLSNIYIIIDPLGGGEIDPWLYFMAGVFCAL